MKREGNHRLEKTFIRSTRKMLQKQMLTILLAFAALALQAIDFISHRGESADAPENTMRAFRLAWERDADGVECDVHLSRDGQVVVCHDGNTRRTTGVDLEISRTDWAELSKLDAGSHRGAQFAGEPIPLLQDLLATVPAGKQIYIELKSDNPELVNAVKRLLAETDLKPEQVVLISFHHEQIKRASETMPEYAGYLLSGWEAGKEAGTFTPGVEPLIRAAHDNHAAGLDLAGYVRWPREAIRQWRNAGFKLAVWTIDDEELARYYVENKVDSITSNRAAALKKHFADAD